MSATYYNRNAAAFDPYRYEPEDIAAAVRHAKERTTAIGEQATRSPLLERNIRRLEAQIADDMSRGGSAFTPVKAAVR